MSCIEASNIRSLVTAPSILSRRRLGSPAYGNRSQLSVSWCKRRRREDEYRALRVEATRFRPCIDIHKVCRCHRLEFPSQVWRNAERDGAEKRWRVGLQGKVKQIVGSTLKEDENGARCATDLCTGLSHDSCCYGTSGTLLGIGPLRCLCVLCSTCTVVPTAHSGHL